MIRRSILNSIVVLLGLFLTTGTAFAQTTGTPMPYVKIQFFTTAGVPCAGCLLESYEAGTSTPLPTFSDAAMLTANANPVVLDAGGRASIFLSANSYKFILKTAAGATIWTMDEVQSMGATALSSTQNNIVNGRLSLTSGTAVTTADVTAASTIYFTPYEGNRIALYDGTSWEIYTFAELSIALGSDAASTPYDVFAYISSGAVAIERLAWTNDSTRATALTTQDGVYVKSGSPTRRYLGTYRTTSSIGQTEDSFANRLVWNYYNRVQRGLRKTDSTDTWTYTTATYRQANGSTANQVGVVVGVAETQLVLRALGVSGNTNTAVRMSTSIGEDSATTPVSGLLMTSASSYLANAFVQGWAELVRYPVAGYHYYTWLERSEATGTTTWRGDGAVADELQAGLNGWIMGVP